MSELRQSTRDLLDIGGMWVSSICAVHCALMPLVLPLLPLLGLGGVVSERFETVMISSALVLATVSLYLGWRVHRSPQAVLTASIGIGLIAFAHSGLSHDDAHHVLFSWHTLTLTAGGTLIALAHWRNKKLCHCHDC